MLALSCCALKLRMSVMDAYNSLSHHRCGCWGRWKRSYSSMTSAIYTGAWLMHVSVPMSACNRVDDCDHKGTAVTIYSSKGRLHAATSCYCRMSVQGSDGPHFTWWIHHAYADLCMGARVLLERLLPALLNAVATTVSDADLRFSCLKVMSDLLALLLDLNANGKWFIRQHSLINMQICLTTRSLVLLLSI